MTVQCVDLDASAWTSALDFYEALLTTLGAPRWHGRNINALVDSMVFGGINEIMPPYVVVIRGLDAAPAEVREEIEAARDALIIGQEDFRANTGEEVGVSLELRA
jgi:RNAse (barnase) inhibitor barstar